jgi:hypothetical protein
MNHGANLENYARPEFLRAEDIALELRCSKPHVYKLMAGKVRNVPKLPVLEIGRCKRVRRSTFEQWKSSSEHSSRSGNITPPGTDAANASKGDDNA